MPAVSYKDIRALHDRIVLDSPYGTLTTPGGGEIENGREGMVSSVDPYKVAFDGEMGAEVTVPVHWLAPKDA